VSFSNRFLPPWNAKRSYALLQDKDDDEEGSDAEAKPAKKAAPRKTAAPKKASAKKKAKVT
jgi:hypothetical protein